MGSILFVKKTSTHTDTHLTMSCCRSFLKLSITFANILFAVIGLLMLLGGLWITYDQNNILEKIANITENTNLPEVQKDNLEDLYNYKYLNFLVIGIGALTFLVALIGFCGSVKESSCLLSTHIFLAAVLLVIQVSNKTKKKKKYTSLTHL